MSKINASEARQNLYRLLDQVSEEHEPVLITGKRNNAVPVGEEDWRGLLETVHLHRVPGLVESIREGNQTDSDDMSEDPGW